MEVNDAYPGKPTNAVCRSMFERYVARARAHADDRRTGMGRPTPTMLLASMKFTLNMVSPLSFYDVPVEVEGLAENRDLEEGDDFSIQGAGQSIELV